MSLPGFKDFRTSTTLAPRPLLAPVIKIVWPSKEARDAGNKAIMDDPDMRSLDMPFDGKRLIHGGFELLLDVE